ncbi:hypothetical protein IJG93_03010 [Candidatus Saccharibacteria bacterium]|nr:hypothetical protein [Candidatus Saccharibacteria bacterium]
MMIRRKDLKTGIRWKFFGCFFAVFLMLSSLFGTLPGTGVDVYAEPEEGTSESSGVSCQDSLGSLGWLVCPTTGKISEAVDFLYDKIEDVLVINPVEAEDGSPVYEIWKYFQGVTNIVFIIFLLVIVFSQITGLGINNYGIKKALPKLIIAAVLVNLSFYICSLAVDVSNIFGGSIRGLLESVETSAGVGMEAGTVSGANLAEMYTALASGTALSIGGAVIAFETGAIWMMIPMALGALVSVVIGLITIAMRQAVVTLLIMIAPLAMVAYILPNTEQWFKKWKQLLFQMLIFYPAFSLLFGASSLAGWAIIVSSNNGFGILIGTAVQIFPLFFSWSLMKMSGTILGTINSKLNALASKPLAGVNSWAESHRELSRQKHLASPKAFTPSMRLQQYLSDRKIAREEETREHAETVKNRGLAYAAMRNYNRNGTPSKDGEESYEAQARNARYQRQILRHKNNMNKGMGQLEALKENGTAAQRARLLELDGANVEAFDTLKMEQARGEMIDYKNAKGFHQRMQDAINVHMDDTTGKTKNANGVMESRLNYKRHFDMGSVREAQARTRYSELSKIMEGNIQDAQYAEATAAHAYDTQNKIVATKMQKMADLTPPTQDLVYRMNEFTKNKGAAENIDLIIPALKALNMRGDTDLVKAQIDNILNKNIGGGVELGTHASQSLASFLMFDVKDSDPWLRRFGKYINLETARIYNSNDRKNMELTYDEYVKGYHIEQDATTGQPVKMYAKKGMKELMEGTSLDNVERTAFASFDDSLKQAYSYVGDDGKRHLDTEEYLRKREEIQTAVGPQFISASLKYLSGSEQLVNAVSFLTGYNHKQKKDSTGNIMLDKNGDPLYEWTASWEDKNGIFADDPETIRKYFNKKALQYVTDQTPSQILSMRSDYYAPMLNHLAMAYEETDMEGWTDEQVAEHEEYMKELSEIQTRYADLPPDEAKKKRDIDRKKLKDRMAGAQFRQLLDSRGKLNQIYRTRRSGAANNAKDWLRKWLDLDNDVAITMRLDEVRKKEKEEIKKARQDKQSQEGGDTSTAESNRVYTDADIADFVSHVEDMWQDFKSEDDEVFYEESHDYIKKTLSADSYIVKEYEKYRENEPTADSHTLKDYLVDLLSDPENY